MRLLRVGCFGVAGVPDGIYPFGPPGSDEPFYFVLVTGPAASGKTRLLEAIIAAKEVIAPTDADVRASAFLLPGADTARVEMAWVLDDDNGLVRFHDKVIEAEVVFGGEPEPEGVLSFELSVYAHGPDAPKLEYFHAHRRLDPWGLPLGLDPGTHRPLRASGSARKYAFVAPLLRRIAVTGEREAFVHRLAALGATCSFDAASAAEGGPPFRSRRGAPLGLGELSSGDEDAVIFAATATLVGLDRSLVLVDRPEMFLPLAPAALPAALCALGRGAQVIAASASPALRAAVPPAQVVTLGSLATSLPSPSASRSLR
jgi:hypothetical protein